MIEKLTRYKITVTIIFFGLLFILLFSRASFTRMEDAGFEAWASLILLLLFWLVVFIDVVRANIYNKTFWVISMIVLPFIAPVFYLFQRKKLLHLKENKFKDK